MDTNKQTPTITQRITALHKEYTKAVHGDADPHAGGAKTGEKKAVKDIRAKQTGRRTAAK